MPRIKNTQNANEIRKMRILPRKENAWENVKIDYTQTLHGISRILCKI